MRTSNKEFASAALISALACAGVFFATPVTEVNFGFDTDGVLYGAMAGSELFPDEAANVAPWCYRVLTPFVVSLIPTDTLTGFRIIAFASCFVSLLVFYLILRRLGFDTVLSHLGVVLYAGVFWTVKWSFYSPAYVDSMTGLFYLLTAYLVVSKRFYLVAATLAVGVLQKESIYALALFAVIYLWKTKGQSSNWQVLAKTLLLCMPAAVVMVLTRQLVEGVPHPHPHFSANPLIAFWHSIKAAGTLRFIPLFAQAIFSGLGILPVLLVLHAKECVAFLRGKEHWLAFSGIAIVFLFGGIDKARTFLYLLPLVLLISVHILASFREAVSRNRFLLGVGLLVAVHLFMGGHLTPMPGYEEYLAERVPTWAEWDFLPYLARNIVLGGLFSVLWVRLRSTTGPAEQAPANT